ncbi:nucleotide-diphospho-sugar transferase [Neurospora crassa]|uniref:Mannose-1-phosphate guanyltransferase n=1 Tax=Neurospora crassa (strain ATCC 24698 / 74-OR23-1A / CBS 708.71 / DSM 1257 / FGSC 987) TaxID=367110 RepID=Q7S4E5_NEUCR|nr:translation initiation factor eif-2b epsilon subunit [Neurospora crassa OR74A]EAA30360.1 translation initiation factor eif-2b epsilon subunit [Neurospora crassa OR74A]KHE78396.1 nucleotide-diphospho-sugar transferase [Neurospora crassa]|eukprot:XP_959596.1 translation initiation factor eif-2b epsilon subunit [Neurospora crassa OR74A]
MSGKQVSKGGAANKSKKPAKGGAEEKREDALQAVILADSFQDRFQPFALEKPRCLLPLVNVPVIEYTLEYLASNGVQEVFIYCGAHSEDVETYIHDSDRWSPESNLCPFSSVDFIRVSDASSIGDFLRDLDKRSLISGDFILIHGDVVANIPLDGILARHRARREANRDACMTIVLRSTGDSPHRTAKARGITPVFVVDPTNGRCLQYEEMHPLQKDKYVKLDESVFEYAEFDLRTDLIDCGIDICTPDVLALWSESFDYELPRKNFLHGVLKDWELNGKIISAEILEEGYGARASNLQMYDCISKDILHRWALPYVPDSNLLHGQTYKYKRGLWLEDGAHIAKNSTVTKSVLGKTAYVDTGSTISSSIIGRRCQIGKNVRIENSYIWDDAVIEDGATVLHSIVANDAVIGKHSYIPQGSLISYGVRISAGTQLSSKPLPRISLFTSEREPVKTDIKLVGNDGKGAQYKEPEDDEDSDSEDEGDADPAVLQSSLIYSLAGLNISSESISTLATHDSDDDLSDDEYEQGLQAKTNRERLSSFASDDSAAAVMKLDQFHGDAVHGLVDALRADDNEDFDSAKLEFMGLRLANNASDSMMRKAIAVAFATRAAELMSPENGGLEPTKAAGRALTSKKGAVKFITEVGVGGNKVDLHAEFALALQKALAAIKGLDSARAGTLLAAMLQQLYNLDVLEEEGILAWWADARAAENDTLSKIKERSRVLVEWLENADEEDSNEDSDEEDEDSD